ncbi:MAG: hypothetical protein KDC54_18740 [Lewinella sp.]|nr:hypothetical protein [Lewinella sp.]
MRTLGLLLMVGWLLSCQPAPAQTNYFSPLHAAWSDFQEPALQDRRFKHEDIVPLLQGLGDLFTVEVEGQSVEGRDIYRVTAGSGSTTVLLWSQMHGDEPTATAALFDIFRFLAASGDEFDPLRRTILNNLKIVVIPMLNPDGAERFQRRNALGIDLNRDAVRLTSPEARLLKAVRDETDADWGFNLHDQSRYYGAGYPTENVATLSFLAPAYNFRGEVNSTRERAMQLIGQLNNGLQSLAPGRIARYSDAFEPRAFGDNIQKWGTSTILIESGGNPDDREKQEIRQLNFVSLLVAFHSIATGGWQSFTRQHYNRIPYNKYGHFNDLILREVTVERNGGAFLLDISFNLNERDHHGHREFYLSGGIVDVGDLTYQQGYEEVPPSGLRVEIARPYPELFEDMDALRNLDLPALLADGYAIFRIRRLGPAWTRDQLPILVTGVDSSYDQAIEPGSNPPLLLKDGTGTVRYVVINGQLYDAATASW